MKRKISIFLVMCMFLSIFPTNVFATENCEHEWNNVNFVWGSDYSCKVTRECSVCNQAENIDCRVQRDCTQKATCTETGEYVYTATATTVDGETYTDEKYVSIKATGHSYNGNDCKYCGEKLLSKPNATATSNGLTKIKVSWKKVNNAAGYYIYRSTSKNGTYKKIKTSTSSARYYIDTNRTAGKTYYYKVFAYKGTVKSAPSTIVSAKGKLNKPVMKTSVSATGSSIKVSWSKVSEAKGYIVYKKRINGSWTKVATIKKNSTLSYTDKKASGLYQYSVKAYKAVNKKTHYSDRAEAIKTRTLKKPSINVVGTNDTMQNIITWNKVTGATNYEIYYKIGTNGTWKKAATVGNVKKYTTKKVNHGKYYYYKVRALYKNNGVTTRGYFSNIENRIHYYYPNVSTFMSDRTNADCGAVAMILTNNGVGKVRIYSEGAKLIDSDYDDFDRNLQLADENGYTCNYIDIAAGSSETFGFYVLGDRTWYDERSSIRFKMYYDGVYYICYASSRYGFSYYEID